LFEHIFYETTKPQKQDYLNNHAFGVKIRMNIYSTSTNIALQITHTLTLVFAATEY